MMRKFITVLMVGVLLAVVFPALAQDSGTQTQTGQQGQGIPIVTGLDVYQRAGAAFDAKDYEKAITDYSLFILLNPTVGEGYFQRAQSYLQLNDLDAALVDLNHTLELPPASPDAQAQAYMLRAAIFTDREEVDSAMADLNAALKSVPDSADALYRRARLYLSQQQFEPAVVDLNDVVRLAPDFPDAYYFRALANTALEAYDAAIEDYGHLIDVTPDDPTSFAGRADLYIRQEAYADALNDLDAALKLDPTIGGLYLQRGMVNNRLGNAEAAAADYLEWIRGVRQGDLNQDVTLRPGESQVLNLQTGLVYAMPFEGQSGQLVSLTASARAEATVDPLLLIMDTNGRPLTADDDSGGHFDSAITDFRLPADGTYIAILSHAGGGSEGIVRVLLEINSQ